MVNGLFTVVMELFGPFKGKKLCSFITAFALHHYFIKHLHFFLLIPSLTPPSPHSNVCIHCEMHIIFVNASIILVTFSCSENTRSILTNVTVTIKYYYLQSLYYTLDTQRLHYNWKFGLFDQYFSIFFILTLTPRPSLATIILLFRSISLMFLESN